MTVKWKIKPKNLNKDERQVKNAAQKSVQNDAIYINLNIDWILMFFIDTFMKKIIIDLIEI